MSSSWVAMPSAVGGYAMPSSKSSTAWHSSATGTSTCTNKHYQFEHWMLLWLHSMHVAGPVQGQTSADLRCVS